jgi:hypothetical protein
MARRSLSMRQSTAGATTLRGSFCSLRPDLDKFLFAEVGDETEGMPLSVISALTRLGLDPWEEAERLSSLRNREAVEQLARLIAELPGNSRPLAEARGIASGVVPLLPKHNFSATPPPQVQIRPLLQTGADAPKALPILGCVFRPRGSGTGQRPVSRRVSVRYWKPISNRSASRRSTGSGGTSVSPSEDRRLPRRAGGDNLATR